jgi:hypothetical protein
VHNRLVNLLFLACFALSIAATATQEMASPTAAPPND